MVQYFAYIYSLPPRTGVHPNIFLILNRLGSTAFVSHPEGCPDEPSALSAPSLPACGWAPPAYGRGWPRFAVATFRMMKTKP